MKNKIRALIAAGGVLLCATSASADKQFYKMSTLGPGSTVNLIMTSFAQEANATFPDLEIQVNATGAGTKHLLDGVRNELDFFISGPMLNYLMANKLAMYSKIEDADELVKNQRVIFNYPLGQYHFVTFADTGITSFADMRGKRIFAGPPGGGATNQVLQMIKAVTGMEPGADFTQVNLSWAAAAQAFQDHQIDVYVNPTNWPSPAISQVALTNKIRLIGFSAEDLEQEAVKKLYNRPGGALDQIPADAYGENQVNEEQVTTIAAIVGLSTNKWMDDETVYKITKNFFAKLREAEADQPWLRHVNAEAAFTQLNAPLHPGAIRYYEEIGISVPDKLQP